MVSLYFIETQCI